VNARWPSPTEGDDYPVLMHALEYGVLPEDVWAPTREAFTVHGYVTADGAITDYGLEKALAWRDLRALSVRNARKGGPYSPMQPGGRRDDSREARADARPSKGDL
jgi:hypothetical protein